MRQKRFALQTSPWDRAHSIGQPSHRRSLGRLGCWQWERFPPRPKPASRWWLVKRSRSAVVRVDGRDPSFGDYDRIPSQPTNCGVSRLFLVGAVSYPVTVEIATWSWAGLGAARGPPESGNRSHGARCGDLPWSSVDRINYQHDGACHIVGTTRSDTTTSLAGF